MVFIGIFTYIYHKKQLDIGKYTMDPMDDIGFVVFWGSFHANQFPFPLGSLGWSCQASMCKTQNPGHFF